MKRAIIIGTWVLLVVSSGARAGEPIDLLDAAESSRSLNDPNNLLAIA